MRFFTSDLHFGHQNIIKYADRPFSSVDEMNETLIENWNSVVRPGVEDEVWVLGDFAMGKIADTLPLAKRLNGFKLLVPGNHDRCWRHHGKKRLAEWQDKYCDVGFALAGDMFMGDLGGMLSVFCHFPVEGDSQHDDRYADVRPRRVDANILYVHGHTHSRDRVVGDHVHVGTDAWDYTPVSEDRLVEEILASR